MFGLKERRGKKMEGVCKKNELIAFLPLESEGGRFFSSLFLSFY